MTTLLIDGNNLVYRCASVMNLTTKSGEAIGGVYGTLNSISSYLNDLSGVTADDIGECIIVFDGGRSTRRTSVYPEYKGGRKTDAERNDEEKKFYQDFLNQTHIISDNIGCLGIKTIQIKGWEADDIIYGIINKSTEIRENSNYVIVSTDEDFMQLVDKNVSIYSPIKQIYYNYDNFEELFGCKPEYFISYKLLKGDSSDNIPGINGIGEKIGKKLVNQYGGISGLLNPLNRVNLMKSKVSQRILTPEGISTLNRNNQLINLKEFVDYSSIEDDITELLLEQITVDIKDVKQFLMKYQMSSILVKLKEWVKPYKDMVEVYYRS